MQCFKCGYEFSPHEGACPRCKERDTPTGTRRLPDLQSSKTQHLVQIQTCPNCRFILYPGSTVCPSCGRALTSVPSTKSSSSPSQIRFYLALAAGGILVAVLFYFLLKKVL